MIGAIKTETIDVNPPTLLSSTRARVVLLSTAIMYFSNAPEAFAQGPTGAGVNINFEQAQRLNALIDHAYWFVLGIALGAFATWKYLGGHKAKTALEVVRAENLVRKIEEEYGS